MFNRSKTLSRNQRRYKDRGTLNVPSGSFSQEEDLGWVLIIEQTFFKCLLYAKHVLNIGETTGNKVKTWLSCSYSGEEIDEKEITL